MENVKNVISCLAASQQLILRTFETKENDYWEGVISRTKSYRFFKSVLTLVTNSVKNYKSAYYEHATSFVNLIDVIRQQFIRYSDIRTNLYFDSFCVIFL